MLYCCTLTVCLIAAYDFSLDMEVSLDDHHDDSPCEETYVSAREASASCQTQTESRRLSITDFISDEEGFHHYTGLETFTKFMLLFNCLGPLVYDLIFYKGTVSVLPPEDQLLVTLMKLRFSLDDFEICRKFNIAQSILTNIFITWINFLSRQLYDLGFWTEADLCQFYSPTDFFSKYPTTRVIIDGTECPVAKPKQALGQQSTFSSYKNRNTLKVLVGCSPGGLVSYCSDAYGGSTSDRQIAERSNLPIMCNPGDSVMADKGFNVQDLFESRDVKINIPSFFTKKNRMNSKAISADRQIASKRVHVERIIGLAKTFKILKHPFNNTQSALGSEIIKVCFYLCNFKKCIVPKSA